MYQQYVPLYLKDQQIFQLPQYNRGIVSTDINRATKCLACNHAKTETVFYYIVDFFLLIS